MNQDRLMSVGELINAINGFLNGLRNAPDREGKMGSAHCPGRRPPLMSPANFWRATVAGFLATYVMTMTGFWQAGVGLPKLDTAATLAANMGHGYAWGMAAHFLNGTILALIYATWFYDRLPGGRLAKGVVYGLILTLVAWVVVGPLVSPAGPFFLNTPAPLMMLAGSLIVHLGYGIALGLSYTPEAQ